MTIDLVTGGAGFIGSHLVRRLVRDGRTVRVVDDLSTGDLRRIEDVRTNIEFVQADLAGAELEPILRGVQRVFHLAAVPSVPRSVREPATAHASVATATLRLLIAARDAGVGSLVVSSSSSVYGESPTSPKREDLPTRPLSPYGVAKLAAEGYARVFAGLHGLRTVSLRYFNVFGPSQDPHSPYAAVIPRFVIRALGHQPVPVYGDGEQTRDFTFVENVVEANLAAIKEHAPAGGVYNIAAGEPRSINQLIASLERILGRRLTVRYAPRRPGDILHSHADVSLARRELRWAPDVSFEEGLHRTVAWYRAH